MLWKRFSSKIYSGVCDSCEMEQREKRSIIQCRFPEKKGYKDFYGLDLDYVLSYSDDLPFKYHTLKAEFIVRISKEASIQKSPDEMKAGTEDMESLDDESEDKCI